MQAAANQPRQCPRCAQSLLLQLYEGVEIDECPSCKGAYLDADELSKILKARGIDVRAYQRQSKAGVPPEERATVVPCPSCGSGMKPTNFNYSSGTILDRCGSCLGVWCDGQELERAQAHYESHQDKMTEKAPALIALVTNVEHSLAKNLRVFRRWNLRKLFLATILLVAGAWMAWEWLSPLSPTPWMRLLAIALPAYFLFLAISRCPVCAKAPTRAQWRRPWAPFALQECERCGIPLTR